MWRDVLPCYPCDRLLLRKSASRSSVLESGPSFCEDDGCPTSHLTPGGTYGPPVRIVAMASDCVNVFAPSQPTPVDCPGPGELWHRPRPSLWPDDGCRPLSLWVGLPRNDPPRTAPRLVSGCQGQERCQTGPQTA